MSIAGVPLSLWQQLAGVADVTFVGAGGQAPIITAKPGLSTTNINPLLGTGQDSFTLSDPLMAPNQLMASNQPRSTGIFSDKNATNGLSPFPSSPVKPESQGAEKPKGGKQIPPGLAKKDTNGLPPGIAKKLKSDSPAN